MNNKKIIAVIVGYYIGTKLFPEAAADEKAFGILPMNMVPFACAAAAYFLVK